MDGVLQLAHVAAPGMRRQPQQRRRATAAGTAARSPRRSGARNARRAPRCRRAARAAAGCAATTTFRRKYRSSRNAPRCDLGRQVAVGGGEDAHVHPHRRGAAEPVDLALLQRAQQLGLQPDVHLADLVEQQRAAIGRLELADAARDGAGERALLVAEQLATPAGSRGSRRSSARRTARRRGGSGGGCGGPAPPCRCRTRR